MPFALGVYGWLLHAFRHAHKGMACAPCALCKLTPCVQSGCSRFCTARHPGVRGDNFCRCNTTAFHKTFSEFWRPADQPVSSLMCYLLALDPLQHDPCVCISWLQELIYMSVDDLVESPAYGICVDRGKTSAFHFNLTRAPALPRPLSSVMGVAYASQSVERL